jgi:hypothetical protein
MEACPSSQSWHNETTHHAFLESTSGECLHFELYFIDEQFGLCSVRVTTGHPSAGKSTPD